MALIVARKKHHRQTRDFTDAQRRRRLAPRALDVLLAHFRQPWQIVDAGAADDSEHRFGHVKSPPVSSSTKANESVAKLQCWWSSPDARCLGPRQTQIFVARGSAPRASSAGFSTACQTRFLVKYSN